MGDPPSHFSSVIKTLFSGKLSVAEKCEQLNIQPQSEFQEVSFVFLLFSSRLGFLIKIVRCYSVGVKEGADVIARKATVNCDDWKLLLSIILYIYTFISFLSFQINF